VRGWVSILRGRPAEAVTSLEESLQRYEATGACTTRPAYLNLLAVAKAFTGHPEAGLPYVREGIEEATRTRERLLLVELGRSEGELILRSGGSASEAEACFRRACQLARDMGLRSPELRATSSLARLLDKQGRKTEAREVLAPIVASFTEGHGTRDLRDAAALLEGLSS
jgi:predicted ATPase